MCYKTLSCHVYKTICFCHPPFTLMEELLSQHRVGIQFIPLFTASYELFECRSFKSTPKQNHNLHAVYFLHWKSAVKSSRPLFIRRGKNHNSFSALSEGLILISMFELWFFLSVSLAFPLIFMYKLDSVALRASVIKAHEQAKWGAARHPSPRPSSLNDS